MEAPRQFLFAWAAERPRFFEWEYLHDRHDDLIDVVTAVASQ
jgi:hypothetical protein